jgi:hypothetical protein
MAEKKASGDLLRRLYRFAGRAAAARRHEKNDELRADGPRYSRRQRVGGIHRGVTIPQGEEEPRATPRES